MYRSDTGPFALVPEWVLDAAISAQAVRLYAVLSRYADAETGECWPSRQTLADRLGCSLNTADRARQELVAAKMLVQVARFDPDTRQRSNLYTVIRVDPSVGRGVPAAAQPLLPADGEQNENQVEREPVDTDDKSSADRPPRARSVKQQRRDRVWDALALFFGEPETDGERTRMGKVVSELVKVDAEPEQVVQACAEMRRRGWENPTPLALTANWTSLLRSARKPSAGSRWDQQADAHERGR